MAKLVIILFVACLVATALAQYGYGQMGRGYENMGGRGGYGNMDYGRRGMEYGRGGGGGYRENMYGRGEEMSRGYGG